MKMTEKEFDEVDRELFEAFTEGKSGKKKRAVALVGVLAGSWYFAGFNAFLSVFYLYMGYRIADMKYSWEEPEYFAGLLFWLPLLVYGVLRAGVKKAC